MGATKRFAGIAALCTALAPGCNEAEDGHEGASGLGGSGSTEPGGGASNGTSGADSHGESMSSTVATDPTEDDTASDGEGPTEFPGVGVAGMRRLSRAEIDATLRDLLEDDTRPGTAYLPEDVVHPFDNDLGNQVVSTVLVESLETMASDVAARLVADPSRRAAVVGCLPSTPADAACMTSFVTQFGRRALRRPLRDEEVEVWTQTGLEFAEERGDFFEGVDVVVRIVLQHPNFVYRVEIGEPTQEPGVFRLDNHEVATRLSYFLWGSTPPEALLDRADAGTLRTVEEVASAAADMLADPRARERVDRFHAMWLGYYTLPHPAELTAAMRRETRALLDDVIFETPRSYHDVFLAEGTFLDDTLAELYGMPAPGSDTPTWVDYEGNGRKGLLSHGSFLSVAAKFGDTSPTQRGLLIRNRLLCQEVPPPPPTVDVDNPPGENTGDCKVDRYEEHRSNGACFSCHEQIDPVGFGLERYDQQGRYRTVEAGNEACSIPGSGSLDGQGFSGPGELADVLLADGRLDACLATQVYRLAMGHEALDLDRPVVDAMETAFAENGQRFDALLLALVGNEAFLYRREEE